MTTRIAETCLLTAATLQRAVRPGRTGSTIQGLFRLPLGRIHRARNRTLAS